MAGGLKEQGLSRRELMQRAGAAALGAAFPSSPLTELPHIDNPLGKELPDNEAIGAQFGAVLKHHFNQDHNPEFWQMINGVERFTVLRGEEIGNDGLYVATDGPVLTYQTREVQKGTAYYSADFNGRSHSMWFNSPLNDDNNRPDVIVSINFDTDRNKVFSQFVDIRTDKNGLIIPGNIVLPEILSPDDLRRAAEVVLKNPPAEWTEEPYFGAVKLEQDVDADRSSTFFSLTPDGGVFIGEAFK